MVLVGKAGVRPVWEVLGELITYAAGHDNELVAEILTDYGNPILGPEFAGSVDCPLLWADIWEFVDELAPEGTELDFDGSVIGYFPLQSE